MRANALTIAGSDSGGGAGIQIDLRTFAAFEVWGLSVLTAITAQNTRGVQAIEPVSAMMVRAQLHSVFSDFEVRVAKTGMLFSAEIIAEVARSVPASVQLIVDPVMLATSGASLLREDAVTALRDQLLPRAWMLTPNIPEAEVLTGLKISGRAEMQSAASSLRTLGPQYVLVKGGHLSGDTCPDFLLGPEGGHWFEGPRVPNAFTHGTGCRLSAAITAEIAIGQSAPAAVAHAKTYLNQTIFIRPTL